MLYVCVHFLFVRCAAWLLLVVWESDIHVWAFQRTWVLYKLNLSYLLFMHWNATVENTAIELVKPVRSRKLLRVLWFIYTSTLFYAILRHFLSLSSFSISPIKYPFFSYFLHISLFSTLYFHGPNVGGFPFLVHRSLLYLVYNLIFVLVFWLLIMGEKYWRVFHVSPSLNS